MAATQPLTLEEIQRAEQMHKAHVFFVNHGISKTKLAHPTTSMSREALSNKFSWATAIFEFRTPTSRDKFTQAQAKEITNLLRKMQDHLTLLLQ